MIDEFDDSGIDDETADYMPTPAQIREACAEIRSKWNDATRASRNVSGWFDPKCEAA